jgi:lipoprotein-anchoring transpeptidase ErfK/SrfK
VLVASLATPNWSEPPDSTQKPSPETIIRLKVRYMDKMVLMTILFVSLATGCAYHERVASVPPPPVVIGSINASTMRSGTRVIINLSEQRAYLIEGGKVSLISPIASGKPGWSTPTGNFSVISKDIDHRSQSFGSVVDGSGVIATSNATPGTYVPPGFHYQPAPMPYYMEFSQAVGMHAGFLPGYPASHGCVRMPRDLAARFFERVNIGTPVTVAGSTWNLTSVRKAIPLFY